MKLISICLYTIVFCLAQDLAASLPDELDAKKYEALYSRAKENSDSLRREARNAYDDLMLIRSQIENLKDERFSYEDRIKEAERKFEDLKRENNNLSFLISKARRDNYSRKGSIERARKNISELSYQIRDLRQDENQKLQEHRRISKELEESKRAFRQKQEAYNAANKKLSHLQDKRNDVRKEMMSVKAKVDRMNLEKAQAKRQIEEKRRKINKLKEEIKSGSGDKNKLSKKIKSLKAEIKQLEALVARLKGKQELAEVQLKELKNQGSRLEAEVEKAKDNVREKKSELRPVKAKMDRVEEKFNDVRRELKNIQDKKRNLTQRQQEQERHIKRSEDTIEENLYKIRSYERRISENSRSMEDYKRDHERFTREVEEIERDLDYIRIKESRAEDVFDERNFKASQAEAVTQQAHNQYLEVKRRYESKVDEAVDKGKTAGLQEGRQQGDQEGLRAGQVDGRKSGEFKGREHGLLSGYYRGKVNGEEVGDRDGYEAGLKVPEKRQEGYDEGLRQGDQEALAEARRREFPRGRADKRDEMFRRELREVVFRGGTQNSSFESVSFSHEGSVFEGAVLESSLLGTPLEGGEFLSSALELESFAPGAFSGDFDQTPSVVCQAIAREERGINEPQVRSMNCGFTYDEFNRICERAYKDNFLTAYKSAYRKSYVETKYLSCVESYNESFDQAKNLRYKEGYEETYSTAYRKALERGAHDIWKQGYNEGYQKSYNENLPSYSRQEYERGEREEENFFLNNSVVVGREFSIKQKTSRVPGSIVAGDTLSVKMAIANYGGKDTASSKNVKVRLSSSSDSLVITHANQWVELPNLEAYTLNHFLDFSEVRVKQTAIGAERVNILLEIELPSGKLEQESVSLSIAPSLKAQMGQLKYRDVSVGRFENQATIAGELRNIGSATPVEPVKLILTIPSQYEYFLSGSQTHLVSPHDFAPGDTASFKFTLRVKYSKLRFGRSVTVRLPVTVTFQGVCGR